MKARHVEREPGRGGCGAIAYTLVSDTVNLTTQRLQQWAEPGETVLSEPTWENLGEEPEADLLEPSQVNGREEPVGGYRFPRRDGS